MIRRPGPQLVRARWRNAPGAAILFPLTRILPWLSWKRLTRQGVLPEALELLALAQPPLPVLETLEFPVRGVEVAGRTGGG